SVAPPAGHALLEVGLTGQLFGTGPMTINVNGFNGNTVTNLGTISTNDRMVVTTPVGNLTFVNSGTVSSGDTMVIQSPLATLFLTNNGTIRAVDALALRAQTSMILSGTGTLTSTPGLNFVPTVNMTTGASDGSVQFIGARQTTNGFVTINSNSVSLDKNSTLTSNLIHNDLRSDELVINTQNLSNQ